MLRTKPQLLNAAAWPPDPRYQFLRAGSVPCWSPSAVHWRSSPQQCWRHRLGKVPRYMYVYIYILCMYIYVYTLWIQVPSQEVPLGYDDWGVQYLLRKWPWIRKDMCIYIYGYMWNQYGQPMENLGTMVI